MLVGVPKEVKNHEYRVGLTPQSVREVVHNGHKVLVESGAGVGIGASDTDYESAGADIAGDSSQVFAQCELVIKVKEPQSFELAMLRPDQILFTYLHLAPDPEQTKDLVASGSIAIAYETVTSPLGGLPLLAPMSEVAGRLAIQAGAHCLEKVNGGSGILIGGVPGVEPAKVVVIGGGVVGTNAAHIAIGMGANVYIVDRSTDVLKALSRQFGNAIKTVYSTRSALEEHVLSADIVVGGVLIPGATAPKLVTTDMIKGMKPGSVVVDVAIDQGGCFETSRATTHDDPTYVVDNIVHYCVANMPGAVPRTSTHALNNVTLPFVLKLAGLGYKEALNRDIHLRNGLNVHKGEITYKEVAEDLGYGYRDALEAINS